MNRDKQIDTIYEDLVEIFDEEYNQRNLITPQNTAEKMTDKGYRKASEVAREIFEELIDNATFIEYADGGRYLRFNTKFFAELKNKYSEGEG